MMKKFFEKNKTILLLLGGVALILFLTSASRKKKTAGQTPTDPTTIKREGFPLKYGSKGKYVRALQRWLNAKKAEGVADFGANLIVDGKFGDKTLTALRLIWNEVEGYPVREVNEVQYLANDIHLYE